MRSLEVTPLIGQRHFLNDRVAVWTLGKRAERFGRLPSEIAGIENGILAYWFDEVVEYYVGWVEGKLKARDEKGKPLYRLDKLLGIAQYAVVKRKR